MSDGFDSRTDCPAVRRINGAYIQAFLDEVIIPMRMAARGCGYALAVHGSLQRDIDIAAIPWTEGAQTKEMLLRTLCGVVAGVVGRANPLGEWSAKPHGRYAMIIITAGAAEIDLSVMPLVQKEKAE